MAQAEPFDRLTALIISPAAGMVKPRVRQGYPRLSYRASRRTMAWKRRFVRILLSIWAADFASAG
jgi:hypothetical protein